jgi:uncharacterized protein (DUF1330 family)
VKYYIVAEIEVTDQSWIPDYIQNVTGMVERHGGRYLARTSNIQKMEGDRTAPGLFVIIEWTSKEAAVAFYESEEYRQYLDSRLAGAKNETVLITGEDVAKVAQIPD